MSKYESLSVPYLIRIGVMIQNTLKWFHIWFLSGLNFFLDLFIVKEIKPRYESILSKIPGQQLVGRAVLSDPRGALLS